MRNLNSRTKFFLFFAGNPTFFLKIFYLSSIKVVDILFFAHKSVISRRKTNIIIKY